MRFAAQASYRITLARLAAVMLLLVTSPAAPQAAEVPKVVASIGPVASLAASVMRGVGTPIVLLPAGASPHSYALRPSEARALSSADLVFWVGEALETFLEEPLEALVNPARVVELMESEGLILHPTRAGGIWEAEENGHGHKNAEGHGHGHDGIDPHLWLDPRNATVIVDRIADALAQLDPGRADAYRANARAAKDGIGELDRDLAATLAPLRSGRYVVFHDAYQYLEHRYGLTPLGAVTVGPDRSPGARRLARLRDEIRERGAVCAFREPQFAPRVLDSLGADTGIRVGVLDPLGAGTAPGPDGYATLMRGLAASLVRCLSDAG